MLSASLLRLLCIPRNLVLAPSPGATNPIPLSPLPGGTPANSPPSIHDVADLALQVSIGIVTVVTLFIGAIAIFGIREAKDVRKLSKQLKAELKESRRTKTALESRLKGLEAEFETFVLAAHLFHEGETAYLAADYDRAISYYEEVLTLQPDNGKVHIRLARALTNKGFYSRAERSLRIALQRDDKNSDALRALATIKRYVDLNEAIDLTEKALLCDDSSADNWNYLGLLLRDARRYEESFNAHNEALRIVPTDGITCFFKALSTLHLGHTEEANHLFYEAHLRSESLQKTNRVKPIWAMVIEWAYLHNLDNRVSEEEAVTLARRLAEKCKEKRNRQAVLSHMLFYLHTKNIDVRMDPSISAFPADDVAFGMAQLKA